ncbi:MAG: hypothetical protein KRP56_03035 [Candidatus Methanogranum gryphiswaldense]|nr:MAG: hypothetical protein KRP56_03035 [Candidatus Methanogranum sp. U3.2.1]
MAKIEIEIPDDMLAQAKWYVENMDDYYDDLNDFFMTAIESNLDMCNDETIAVKKPFKNCFYVRGMVGI